MIALYITCALPVTFMLGVLVGRVIDFGKPDDMMDLVDACQSDTPIYDALALAGDPIDPAAVERIRARVEDELASRRGGTR